MAFAIRTTYFSALALGIAGVLACGQAQASGFQLRENSVKGLGKANAGSAVAEDDASVVSNNPAAMTNLETTTFQIDATAIDFSAEFSGTSTSAVGTAVSGGDGGDAGGLSAVPAFAVVVPLHGAFDGLTVGASVSVPFGLTTEYDSDWMGRYNAIKSEVEVIDLTLSAALKLTDRLSVGAGLIYESADVTLSNAVDFGTALMAAGVSGFTPGSADGTATVSGDDTGVGWIVGVQFKPTDKLSIGYSHRSEIDHDLQGTADFDVPASAAAVFSALGVTSYDDGDIYAPLTLPSIDTLSAMYKFSDRFRMMADIQKTDWHSLPSVDIYRADGSVLTSETYNWEDSMFYSLGGEYDLNDRFTLRAGVAYDESPVSDEWRAARLPDNDRMLFSLGLSWKVSPHLTVDAAYQHIQIDDATVTTTSSSSSVLEGTYQGSADLFGISAQYRF